MQKEKKLTAAEQRRAEAFAKVRAELEAQGYACTEKTFGAVYANVMAIVVMLPYAAVMVAAFILFNGLKNSFHLSETLWLFELELLLLMVGMVACLFVHELIHGICFAAFAKDGWKSVAFGFNRAALAPYCTTSEPLTKRQYLVALVMPTVFLGFLLGAAGIATGNGFVFLLSVIMLFGGGGDFLMIYSLLKIKTDGRDILFFDHPTAIGSCRFERPRNGD